MLTDPNKAPLDLAVNAEQPEPADSVPDRGWLAPWSFRWVMLRFHRLIYRVAFHVLHDGAEAEDICQEVFSKYWTHHQSVEQPKEWLIRVARNESISRLRKKSRIVLSDQILEPEQDVEGSQQDEPSRHWQQEHEALRLRQAVDTLPEPQRSLIILFDLEEQDGATCAQALNLSVNQVKVYLHRARKRLRQQLEHAL